MPEEIAVIGFDDVEEGAFSTPSLSSVGPDKDFIGRAAVELALSLVDAESPAEPAQLVAPHQLVARESTLGMPS